MAEKDCIHADTAAAVNFCGCFFLHESSLMYSVVKVFYCLFGYIFGVGLKKYPCQEKNNSSSYYGEGNLGVGQIMASYSRNEIFWGEVDRKIHLAHHLYNLFGSTILAVPAMQRQLEGMAQCLSDTNKLMQNMRLPELCSDCGNTSPTGGCCSKTMDEESDGILFLINFLAGFQITVHDNDNRECTFLGPEGCGLPYKPMFCLNYLCRRISDNTPKYLLDELAKSTGCLLQEQYSMELMILDALHEHRCLL